MRRRRFLQASALVAASPFVLWGCSSDDAPAGSARPPARPTGERRRYGDADVVQYVPRTDAPDVLFVSLDDQNDWLGFLNDHPGTLTPNLDALAAESLVFSKAYTAAPMCAPARTGVMFGQPPPISDVYDHSDPSNAAYERVSNRLPSLVDDYWAAGYAAYGTGKVFARGGRERWTETATKGPWFDAQNRDDPKAGERFDPDWISPYDGKPIGTGEAFRAGDIDFGPTGVPLDEEPDMVNAKWAAEHVRLAEGPKFVAYGTVMPHTPWRIPQRFIDQHPVEDVVLPALGPEDLDDLGPYARDEIVDQFRAFERLQASGQWEAAVAHYQAATTFADHCVGVVLNELADSPRADDTIVVVWSDHGFHLGEKLHLHKFTLWERATRVPLLIRAPGLDTGTFDRPVSLLDIGPTLAELCGVEVTNAEHRGASLLPLLDDPDRADDRPPVMTWLEGNHAVRRDRWRYIRYRTGEDELYDVDADPDERENLAGDPAHAETISELAAFLPDD